MTDLENLYLILTLAFIVGICVGSFVTMASFRLPREEDLVFKPSYCPNCQASLRFLDLFPLLSWLKQGGKCRHCKTPISARYPLIECTLGLTFAILVYIFGVSVETGFYLLLATELAILIVTDLEHFIIPDGIQIALFITGVAYAIFRDANVIDVAESAGFGLVLGLALHFGYLYLRKKDGLGWGDVKFLFVAGIWLNLTDFIPFLFLAGVIGTLTGLLWQLKGRGAIFPFGPALALSLFINVLIPDILGRLIV